MTAVIAEPKIQLDCTHCGTDLDVPESRLESSRRVLEAWRKPLGYQASPATLEDLLSFDVLRQLSTTVQEDTLSHQPAATTGQTHRDKLIAILRWQDDGGAAFQGR